MEFILEVAIVKLRGTANRHECTDGFLTNGLFFVVLLTVPPTLASVTEYPLAPGSRPSHITSGQ
jgi:hypothetical protein